MLEITAVPHNSNSPCLLLLMSLHVMCQSVTSMTPNIWLQIDSSNVSVLYETGDSEELATHDVIRDGLLSLGWLDPQRSFPADSDNQLSSGAASAAGDSLTS